MPLTIRKHADQFQWGVYIRATRPDGGRIHLSDIVAHKRLDRALGGPSSATVSWPSIGETDPEGSAIFAEAILTAVKIAKDMDLGIEP